MPQLETVHVKTTLNNVALAYFQEEAEFIAQIVSPIVPVNKSSDYYFVYGREHFNITDAIRRPGVTPIEVEHTLSTDQYQTYEYSLREKVTDEEKKDADNPIAPESDAVLYVSERLRLSHERRIAVQLTTAGNYQTGWKATLAGDDQWNNGTSSDPIADIQTAIDKVVAAGKRPNTLFMGYEVWTQLKHHPDFLNRLAGNKTQIVTADLLKTIWEEIEEVAIGSTLYNTAVEGADEDLGFCWGKSFGVAYVNRAMPNKKVPSFNYTFLWPYKVAQGRVRRTNQAGARNGTPYQARTYRHADEGARSDWVEVAMRTGFKIVGDYMGYLISDAVA